MPRQTEQTQVEPEAPEEVIDPPSPALSVDYKLLSGPESPLRLFSEQWVFCLDPEKLLILAGESRRTRERRERLKKEIQDLELAMEILR
ncbi:hypothetical protein LZ31DRAFT_601980 [Colletotrichum somersetense]|nr:hypothetical protein LZ31DRAFT_601980 [Colletotrichum somersetense]